MADNDLVTKPGDATRRTVLRGAVVTGAAVPLLAACGGAKDDTSSGATGSTPESSGASEPVPKSDAAPAGGGAVVASTDDVPEGGGFIVEEAEVVITQPKAGTFLGFSSICTHQGCQVAEVADGSINCPCHGSKFSIEDGSVVSGPATEPLAEAPLVVSDKEIILA